MSQFFYIHPDNPQQRLLDQAVNIINQGGVIIYPTDSGYALGCQLDNKQALERICQIRQLDKNHNFTLMVRDQSELATYAKVDNQGFRALRNNTPGPYTFLFRATKEVPKRLHHPKRKTIGMRIPDNTIALALLERLGAPLMSTSLLLPGQEFMESDPELIRDDLEHQVDLIIHGGHLGENPTTVVDMTEDVFEVVRVGSGDPSPFQ